jgi:transposase
LKAQKNHRKIPFLTFQVDRIKKVFNNLKETSMKQGTMNILFFILKTKLLKNGEAPILMWITIDGQYEETRIQRSISPKLWDSSKGCGKGKDRATKELNNYIAELSALALQKHKELMLEQALITPKLLLKRVFGKDTEIRTLLGTMREEIEKMKKAVNIDYAPVTINRYINVMKKLEKAILENPQRVALARQTPLTLLAKIRIPPLSGVSSDRDFCIFVSRPGRRLKQ